MARKLTGRVELDPRTGRYVARVRTTYLGTYADKATARRVATAAAAAINDMARAPMTLARFSRGWLDQRERDGVSGIRQERSRWTAHILASTVASLPLRSVRAKHVAQFASELADKPAVRIDRHKADGQWVCTPTETGESISRATARAVLQQVYLGFEGARIAGHISRNPAEGVRVPRMRRQVHASPTDVLDSPQLVQFLSVAEITRVLGALDTEWSALYAVAIYGGLRKGELLALRWEDVDFDGARPHLRVRRSNSFQGTKTTAGARDVQLLPAALAALRAWKHHGGVERAVGPVWVTKGGTMRKSGDPLRWPDKRQRRGKGGAMQVQAGIRSQAGVRAGLRFHDLRHTCASHLVMGTWTARPLSLQQVREWMGHSSISVTERYAHLAPDAIQRPRAEEDGE